MKSPISNLRLHCDEDLVEAVVFLCTSGRRRGAPSMQISRFQREREKLYQIADPEDRNEAFFALHLEWFREWGFEQRLNEWLREFPRLPDALSVLAFRRTVRKNDEGAELYVNETGQRHGIVALRGERFVNDAELICFLRHELTHLQDMIDPAFGYSPDMSQAGFGEGQVRLARERYRLLWDITIDGRLAAAGQEVQTDRAAHEAAFNRAYSFWPETKRGEVFQSLWTHRTPTHSDLMRLATDPRDLRQAQQPLPGAPCPLCGFPTFTWGNLDGLKAEGHRLIENEFPAWTPGAGLCQRCCEAYQVLVTSPNCLTKPT